MCGKLKLLLCYPCMAIARRFLQKKQKREGSESKPSLARRGSGWAGDDDWDEDEGWDDEDGEDLEGGRAAPPAGANNADQVRPLLSAAAPPSSKPPPPQQLSRVAELPAYGGKIASGGAALVAADSLPRPGSTAKALGVAMAPPEPSVEDMFSSMGMGVDKKDVKAAKRISVKTQQRTRKMQTTASTEISYNSDRFKLDDDEDLDDLDMGDGGGWGDEELVVDRVKREPRAPREPKVKKEKTTMGATRL